MEFFKFVIFGFFGFPALLVGLAYAFAYPWQMLAWVGGFVLLIAAVFYISLGPARDRIAEVKPARMAREEAKEQQWLNEQALQAADPNWHPALSLKPKTGPVVIRRLAVPATPRMVSGWADDPAIPPEYRR